MAGIVYPPSPLVRLDGTRLVDMILTLQICSAAPARYSSQSLTNVFNVTDLAEVPRF